MPSFEDLIHMRVGYVPTYYRNLEAPVIYSPENSMLNLILFSICYMLCTHLHLVSPSIASLLGIYYMVGDIVINVKNVRLTAAKDAAEAQAQAEAEEADHEAQAEEADHEAHDEADHEADDEADDEAENDEKAKAEAEAEANDEAGQEADDEALDTNDYEESIELMCPLCRNVNSLDCPCCKTYTDNPENRVTSKVMNQRVLEQLNAFAQHVQFKNLVNKMSQDEYADMPDLVSPDSTNWNDTDMLSYMNPNLRQPGHFAPSVDESLD